MKKIFILALVLVLLIFHTEHAKAHFLANDSGVGVLIHIDPDDDPIANVTSHIHFNFQSKGNVLKGDSCDCGFQIIKDDVILASFQIPSLSGQDNSYMQEYTFPGKGLYTMHIFGKSKKGDFSSFDIKYDLRVDKGGDGSQSENKINYFNLALALGAVVVILFGVVIFPKFFKSNEE